MAKSIRSKAKRSYRAKKRESGIYAASEAARLNRLNAKLAAIASEDEHGRKDGVMDDLEGKDEKMIVSGGDAENDALDVVAADIESAKGVSTHGPRGSRREEWRKSKGLDPKPKRKDMNRQGGLAARRKAGKSKRRR